MEKIIREKKARLIHVYAKTLVKGVIDKWINGSFDASPYYFDVEGIKTAFDYFFFLKAPSSSTSTLSSSRNSVMNALVSADFM